MTGDEYRLWYPEFIESDPAVSRNFLVGWKEAGKREKKEKENKIISLKQTVVN